MVFSDFSYLLNVFLGSSLTVIIVVWGIDIDMPYSFRMQSVNDAT